MFRIDGVSGEQLRLVQLYTNSLPLHTQVLLCCRKFLLACKNGVLELLTTVYGAKELDDCDSLLTICRLAFLDVVSFFHLSFLVICCHHLVNKSSYIITATP